MDLGNKRIILASASPRRRELMAGLDIRFTVDTKNNFTESWDPATPHKDVPILMSRGKSHGFWRELEENEILVTSDTMVLRDTLILGKPHSPEEAAEMLRELSGRTHEVITAVTVRDGKGHEESFSDSTKVRFKELREEEINYYIENYKPFDKAGAYGVQEWIGYAAITGIEGSFYTVMGLPVHLVYSAIKRFLAY